MDKDFIQRAMEEKRKNVIIPDNADLDDIVEKDGLPSTPQIKEFQAMRDELAEDSIKADQIIVRDRSAEVSTEMAGRTVQSDLLDVPKLCDQCYLIDKCPHYKPKHTCYYRTAIAIQDQKSLVDLMRMMLEMQGQRVLFGRLIEQSEGGYLDQNLSKEMKLLMDLMKDFKEILAPPKEEVVIKASGPAKPEGGGILSQIFGGGMGAK